MVYEKPVVLMYNRFLYALVSSVVVEVTLDIDDGSTLITGTGGQIAKGANEIRKPARGGALCGHVAH